MEKSTIHCHSCDSMEHRPYGTSGKNRIVICRDCGLFFVNPVPTPAELLRIVADSDTYTEDQLRKLPFFRARAERLLTSVEALMPAGRLLDIGCAIGTELVVAQERGWETCGIELSTASARLAHDQGLDVRQVPLEEAGFEAGYFDLVTANHVLEHLPWPQTFFAEVRRILKDNGYLFVAVPNVDAFKRYLLRSRYRWAFHDDHFVHYSVATLSKVLDRHGFEVISIYGSRAYDFHDHLDARSRAFRWLNGKVEDSGHGIEIFCLARPR